MERGQCFGLPRLWNLVEVVLVDGGIPGALVRFSSPSACDTARFEHLPRRWATERTLTFKGSGIASSPGPRDWLRLGAGAKPYKSVSYLPHRSSPEPPDSKTSQHCRRRVPAHDSAGHQPSKPIGPKSPLCEVVPWPVRALVWKAAIVSGKSYRTVAALVPSGQEVWLFAESKTGRRGLRVDPFDACHRPPQQRESEWLACRGLSRSEKIPPSSLNDCCRGPGNTNCRLPL